MVTRTSEKQDQWANDIKIRIEILKNGFMEKCNLQDQENQKILTKIDKILNNAKSYYIIDEYKGLTDESLVKMFELSDAKFCKLVIMLFSGKDALYEFKQKQRLENEIKLADIKNKYYKLQ